MARVNGDNNNNNMNKVINNIISEIDYGSYGCFTLPKIVPTTQLLATSGNEQGIVKLIKQFWYSTNITLVPTDDPNVWDVHNAKGKVSGFRVIKVKNKYRFEKI